MARVAINGLGRIGRATLKMVMATPELELVGVNDIADLDNIAYLIKYDTVYGRYDKTVSHEDKALIIDGKRIPYHSERDPANLPWAESNVDLVFECTGFFTTMEDASKHVQAGAKYVIVSGPTKSKDMPTIVHGVNTSDGKTQVISCASCTTNNITPVVEILGRRVGIKKATMTTIHAYTATQELVDGPARKDFGRGRAAAQNIVPSSTGAAVATTLALPQYAGLFNGTSLRVPVAVGSIADITFVTERPTSVEEINQILSEEANSDRYRDILAVADEDLVSSDIIKDAHASIVQLSQTQVVDGDLVKVMTWYDNEWGYTNQMIREALNLVKSGALTTA
ncbi:MAG: type I glyceraldehyde-3-phosphate dehydrogenase [Anaerolineae bacterium]